MLSQICQCNIGRSLPNHEVDGDQTLEDDGPCRIPQPVLEGPEDLAYSSLSGMCRYEDVFDVFRLRGRGLQVKRGVSIVVRQPSSAWLPGSIASHRIAAHRRIGVSVAEATDLDLGRALDGLFKRACHINRCWVYDGRCWCLVSSLDWRGRLDRQKSRRLQSSSRWAVDWAEATRRTGDAARSNDTRHTTHDTMTVCTMAAGRWRCVGIYDAPSTKKHQKRGSARMGRSGVGSSRQFTERPWHLTVGSDQKS